MTNIDALIILNYLRVGPITARRLMDRFGSPAKIFSAPTRELKIASRLSTQNVEKLKNWKEKIELKKVWDIIKKENIQVLTYKDPDYPSLLKEIYDYPLLLYVKGKLKPEDNQAIAMVGTRSPTNYGRLVARKWATKFSARGFTVVSGLARGIDTQSHIGAIEGKGRTIAVLGYGFGYIYPKENEKLFHRIVETGAVITEYPWKSYHGKASFPLRNRLIAGLSRATVVVESRKRGGSMITAHFANEYNRTVFSVPGAVNSSTSVGTNKLIRDGASLASSVDDITEEFEFLFSPEQLADKSKPAAEKPAPKLEKNEKVLYELLDNQMSLDQLAQESDLSIEKVTTAMLMLEFKGLVRALPGKIYVKK